MIINLKLPDTLYEQYLLKYGSPMHYTMMKKAIEEFSNVPSNDRWFGVHGPDRQRIEAVFGNTVNSAKELADRLERLNQVSIEGERLDFEPEELARIDMQAQFHGKDRQTFVRDMVREIKDAMLEKV